MYKTEHVAYISVEHEQLKYAMHGGTLAVITLKAELQDKVDEAYQKLKRAIDRESKRHGSLLVPSAPVLEFVSQVESKPARAFGCYIKMTVSVKEG